MNSNLSLGEVVKLKSGGPKMTIDHFAWDRMSGKQLSDKVVCAWFKDGDLVKAEFPLVVLESWEDEE